MNRKDLDFFRLAQKVAGTSKCVKGGTGAVIVAADGKRTSIGYTGHPSKWTDCNEVCLRKNIASGTQYEIGLGIHAEVNAILNMDYHDRQGATIYTSRAPCLMCARIIAQSGIVRIVCPPELDRVADEYSGIKLIEKYAKGRVTVDIVHSESDSGS